MKEQIVQTANTQTWAAFERSKKKRLIVKLMKRSVFEPHNGRQRFESDAAIGTKLEINCGLFTFTHVVSYGVSEENFWFSQETAGNNRSLFEYIRSGKTMRPIELVKCFSSLSTILIELHAGKQIHRNINPSNIYLLSNDSVVLMEPDLGNFLNPAIMGEHYDPGILGPPNFLAPEQMLPPDGHIHTDNVSATTDVWSLGACLAFALTGREPNDFDIGTLEKDNLGDFAELLQSALEPKARNRFPSMEAFREALQKVYRKIRGTLFTETPNEFPVFDLTPLQAPTPHMPTPPQGQPVPTPPAGTQTPPTGTQMNSAQRPELKCPQCGHPILPNTRVCSHCNRAYDEPCMMCQTLNPFWLTHCRSCKANLAATKKAMSERIYAQQQQVMKLRENFGHDKALTILKQMMLLSHPDFLAVRDWAKSMLPVVQKERKDIRAGIEGVRMQAQAALVAQKYDKVQELLSHVPPALVDDDMRRMYRAAQECIQEVESLINEIRNSIATKKYNTLLACVQRYLELKANDPEAKNLQEKIEKLTSTTSKGGLKLRRIPSGEFLMGSEERDPYGRNNERPQHIVQLTQPMFIGVYPVTQAEFVRLMEFNPSVASDDPLCPVDSVSWYTALEFCNRLSDEDGFPPYYILRNVRKRSNGYIEAAEVLIPGGSGYRLPTEAEWEYTCRAGCNTPWCFGDLAVEATHYGWFFDNAQTGTQAVGQKKPNSWGLYDMHGNVMEWCYDWYSEFYYQHCGKNAQNPLGPDSGSARVIRGGAWHFGLEASRCSCRNSNNPETSSNMIGFRVARTAKEGDV